MTEEEEFGGQLMDDVDVSSLAFAEEAFGCKPDAVNFWFVSCVVCLCCVLCVVLRVCAK